MHANETVAWIAVAQGTGTNNGANYHAGRTANAVTDQNYNIALSGFSSAPIFLCHDDTCDGGNTENRNAGPHAVQWNASRQATGVYFYRLTSGSMVQTKRMMLLK